MKQREDPPMASQVMENLRSPELENYWEQKLGAVEVPLMGSS